jgi:rod shape-determining protein MreC
MSWVSRNRVRLLIAGLLLFAFLLFTAHMKDSRKLNWLDKALLWVTAPVQKSFVWMIDGAASLWEDYIYLVGLREENQVLKAKLEQLERELARLGEVRAENIRLKELVHMRERLGETGMVAARVVSVATSPVSRTIRVDVGSDDGVSVGDAVVAGAGLVGRVSGTVGGYSEVLLMVDSRSAVAVIDQRSRARGIVRGRGEDEVCSVDHLVRTADVQVGDVMVTSEVGGAFPPGLQVGSIVIATSPNVGVFREAELEPVVEFESLEEVMIVTTRPEPPAEEEQEKEKEKDGGKVVEEEAEEAAPEPEPAPEPEEKPEPKPEPEVEVIDETERGIVPAAATPEAEEAPTP